MRETTFNAAAWLRPSLLVKWALFAFLAVIFTLAINRGKLAEYLDARDKVGVKRAEVSRLTTERDYNKDAATHLEQGDFDVERAARERFNLIRHGEKVLIVETPKPAPSEATLAQSDAHVMTVPQNPAATELDGP